MLNVQFGSAELGTELVLWREAYYITLTIVSLGRDTIGAQLYDCFSAITKSRTCKCFDKNVNLYLHVN